MGTLQLTYDLYATDVPTALFVREVLRRGLPYIEAFRWASTDATLAALSKYDQLILQKTETSEECVIEIGDCLLTIESSNGFVHGHVAGPRPRVEAIIETLKVSFPEPVPSGRTEAPVTFWRDGRRGPVASQRTLSVSRWADVENNYAHATRRHLAPLMTQFRPAGSGRLILWHGEPGTGKSHALRALAWEWAGWCRLEYIIDPDRFLEDGEYLMQVLLHDHKHHDDLDLEDEEKPGDTRWRLFALEDAGELMAADARERVGQQLSRLLNTVDGLLGQGLRVMILITTNEPIGRLHPAVSRPGRCAAQIEFTKFSAAEARAWARSHGSAAAINGETSLAELFEVLAGGAIRPHQRTVDSGLYL